MPRAAVLSIHARVEGDRPSSWEDPSLVQLWGPRYQVYVVAERDLRAFSLGRLPDDAKGRAGRRTWPHGCTPISAAEHGLRRGGHGLGINANSLSYGATTGTVLIRWRGATADGWTVPPPESSRSRPGSSSRAATSTSSDLDARAFAVWAGISRRAAVAAFETLRPSLTTTRTPIGDA